MEHPIGLQQRLLRQLTPEQKVRTFTELHRTAWELKRAGVKMMHPTWTEKRIETEVRRIFLYART